MQADWQQPGRGAVGDAAMRGVGVKESGRHNVTGPAESARWERDVREELLQRRHAPGFILRQMYKRAASRSIPPLKAD